MAIFDILKKFTDSFSNTGDVISAPATDENQIQKGQEVTSDSEGTPVEAGAYEILGVWLLNSKGDKAELFNEWRICNQITISESIYTPNITCTLKIFDNKDFFNIFGISAREKIFVKIRKINSMFDMPDIDLEMEFVVYEIPNFEKTQEGINTQEYTIIGQSEFSYLSSLQKISRSVAGNTGTIIKNILDQDMGVTQDRMVIPDNSPGFNDEQHQFQCMTLFKGIITTKTPMEAALWLCGKSTDQEDAPFFLYNRISDQKIRMSSWSDLMNTSNRATQVKPIASEEYIWKPAMQEVEQGTPQYFEQQQAKIIKFVSNINLNPLNQARSGAFGSFVRTIDYLNKDYLERSYVFSDQSANKVTYVNPYRSSTTPSKIFEFLKKTWDGLSSFLNFAFQKNKKYDELSDQVNVSKQSIIEIHLPAPGSNDPIPSGGIFGDGPLLGGGQIPAGAFGYTCPEINYDNLAQRKAYWANLQTETHRIGLSGDFNINPGKHLKIKVPPAENPDKSIGNLPIDARLSGEYIIADVSHVFLGGHYTSTATIVRPKISSE